MTIDELKIKITVDRKKKTISISDNGSVGREKDRKSWAIARWYKNIYENMSKDDDELPKLVNLELVFIHFIVSKILRLSKNLTLKRFFYGVQRNRTYNVQKIKDKNIVVRNNHKLAKDARFCGKQIFRDKKKNIQIILIFPYIYLRVCL
ncbi:MAG: hypothetical protein CM15mP73_2850 [Hyphomicrobiales bacterium]|nr:MAG: hypothetical protein CM15mP73_2850 [Hyphomicrobiales bacterium]